MYYWIKAMFNGHTCGGLMKVCRMFLVVLLGVLCMHGVQAKGAPPANDPCENAQVITMPGLYSGTTIEATGEDLTPSEIPLKGQICGYLDDPFDVWFRVDGGTHPRQYTVDIYDDNPTIFPVTMAIYARCPTFPGDSMVDCLSHGTFLGAPGQSYYIRISYDGGHAGDFHLSVNWVESTTTIPGDLCHSPQIAATNSTFTGSNIGATGNGISGCGGYFDTYDVWYQLTIGPGQGGYYLIDTFGSNFDTVLSIFTRCPVFIADALVACNDDYVAGDPLFQAPDPVYQSQIGLNLSEGAYLIRVAGYRHSTGAITLHVSPPMVPISGETCGNALPLPIRTTVHGDTTGYTGYNLVPPFSDFHAACSLNDRNDIWYTFTAPYDGVYSIKMAGVFINEMTPVFNGCVRVYDACDDGTRMFSCREWFNTGAPYFTNGRILAFAGTTYYVRVAGYNGWQGVFSLLVDPPEDICRADFNLSGGVTVQDIFDFLAAWFAGTPSADFNAVGGVTVQDIFDFLSAWFAGC